MNYNNNHSKSHEIIINLYNRIPKNLREMIEFVSSLIGLLGVVFSVGGGAYKFIKKIVKIQINQTLFAWICCGILIVIIAFMRYKMIQYKTNLWKRKNVVNKSYFALLNEFQVFYFKLLKYHKEKHIDQEVLTDMVESQLKKGLDEICEIFKVYTGEDDINSCVKIITSETDNLVPDKIDVENSQVYTFVRSSNTSTERKNTSENSPVSLKKNTDFKFIVNPPEYYRKGFFYEKDLHKFDEWLKNVAGKDAKYENTNENFWNYYRGVIVVPIRAEHKTLHFTCAKEDYHIIGFLCVDTMSTSAFITENTTPFINIMNAFASLFYLLLNKYKYYLERTEKNGEKQETNHNG